jgi:hypothetical protein
VAFLALPVLASAFCLFLVQPLLAKQILPWFGGAASIWAVCMVFYQAMLLAGYLYAHALARYLQPRAQALTHASVVAASLLALPIGLNAITQPASSVANPGAQVVLILLRAIGIPYFVLSSTSPLMQAWYARLNPSGAAYKLFGWSNLACSLALLSFPFLLEPLLPLSAMNTFWSWSYSAVAALLLLAALFLYRRNPAPAPHEAASAAPTLRTRLEWLFFSALGSALLLGGTNYLCQNIAPVPFLWTVPLLLYLLTFVAVFEREWYQRRWGMAAAGAGLLAMAWAIVYLPPNFLLLAGIPIFCSGIFLGCFYAHGELALRKPHSGRLTEFYIVMAAGGALGSLLVAFGAPAVFRSYSELPVAMSLCALTMLMTVYRRSLLTDIAATACAVLVTAPAFASILSASGEIASSRNFYGSLRIEDFPAAIGRPALRKMVHGSISHGEQYLEPSARRTPLSYYTQPSGVGLALQSLNGPRRIGIVGLGAGTLAAYGRPGDLIRIYEINPTVVDYAWRHFTFLSDTPARVEIATGDGRLLLAAEPGQDYDLLVIDAFSGDSIPIHLLTQEALRLYRRHVKPTGLIALHISNVFLDLRRPVLALAAGADLHTAIYQEPGDLAAHRYPSSWAILGPREALAKLPPPEPPPTHSGRVWTDDYSTLLAALR